MKKETTMEKLVRQLERPVAQAHDDILQFFREIVAIPSMDNQIEAVGQRIGEEMKKLRFDEVYTDKY
ncbi:MAG: hypothetical protein V3T83_08840 [Acidobacteriota bacterium]